MVLMFGANIYQHMNEISREEHEERTILSYIRTKVRNNDEAGVVYVGEFHGIPALYYEESNEGTDYTTVVYHYDGWVMELFSEVGLDFYPQDGVPIMELNELMFEELEHNLIRVSSGTKNLLIFPRGDMAETWPHTSLGGEVPTG